MMGEELGSVQVVTWDYRFVRICELDRMVPDAQALADLYCQFGFDLESRILDILSTCCGLSSDAAKRVNIHNTHVKPCQGRVQVNTMYV
jgi:hypothetical protein